jgi:hypothetical protein
MALVRAAAGADDLGPHHAIAGVANGPKVPFGKGLGEAWPARSAFELGAAVKQRKTAQAAGEDSRTLLLKENATKRRLGAMVQQYVPLFVGEAGNEFTELFIGRRSHVEGGGAGG